MSVKLDLDSSSEGDAIGEVIDAIRVRSAKGGVMVGYEEDEQREEAEQQARYEERLMMLEEQEFNIAAARREGRIDALEWLEETLRRDGATLPAPPPEGTIESAMRTAVCVVLAIVVVELERLRAKGV